MGGPISCGRVPWHAQAILWVRVLSQERLVGGKIFLFFFLHTRQIFFSSQVPNVAADIRQCIFVLSPDASPRLVLQMSKNAKLSTGVGVTRS